MLKRVRPFLSQRGLMAVIGALVSAALIAGCGGGSGSEATTADAGGEAQPGGTIRMAVSGEPLTLDPFLVAEEQGSQISRQINETLFKQEGLGKITPWLATGYKRSKDGLRWEFELRKGVTFSNGSPLTAADVKFSIDAARDGPYFGAHLVQIDQVNVPRPDVVEVVTKKPIAPLITFLACHFMPVVPKDYGGVSATEFASHPIGTGPFEFKSWVHGTNVTLVKNPTYWNKGEPLADEMVFTIIPDDNSRIAQIRSGNADVMSRPSPSQISSLEQLPTVDVSSYGELMIRNLALNMNKPQFKDPRVREAVSLAIDRAGIAQTALGGKGSPAGSLLPPPMKYYDEEIEAPEQDMEKAKKLLAEAVADGADPSFKLDFQAGEAFAQSASQIVQANLNEAGFKVELQPMDEATLYETLYGGKSTAAINLYYAGAADPSNLTTLQLEGMALANGFDPAKLKVLMAKDTEATSELNSQRREQLYKEIQEGVAEEHQQLPLVYADSVYVTQSNFVGLQVNATNEPWFSKAGFTK